MVKGSGDRGPGGGGGGAAGGVRGGEGLRDGGSDHIDITHRWAPLHILARVQQRGGAIAHKPRNAVVSPSQDPQSVKGPLKLVLINFHIGNRRRMGFPIGGTPKKCH